MNVSGPRVLRLRASVSRACIAGLLILCGSGCNEAASSGWYGYYYADIRINAAPELSVEWPDARACIAGMRAYMAHAPATAGFACGQGCPPPHDGGFVSDCKAVAY